MRFHEIPTGVRGGAAEPVAPVRRLDKPAILVAHGDEGTRDWLADGLRDSGFLVRTVANGAEALRVMTDDTPDLLMIDPGLPILDGSAVVVALRHTGNRTPVCAISNGGGSVDQRVALLENGADDFVVRPLPMPELAARARALLRRTTNRLPTPDTVRVGPLEVDIPGHRVTMSGNDIALTKTEFELVALLASTPGVVQSRAKLLERIWGYDFETSSTVLDVFVSSVRRKLECGSRPRVLHTVRGVGFVLRTPARDAA